LLSRTEIPAYAVNQGILTIIPLPTQPQKP
jgi:hypothetical protein